MRVCIVAHRFYDANAHMMQFANALAKRGDDVDVISLRREGLSSHDDIDGVHVLRLQARKVNETRAVAHLLKIILFFLRVSFVILWRHLRKPYQVIHIQSVPDFLVFTALIPRILRAKVILDLRDLVPELYAAKFGVRPGSITFRLLLAIERASAAFADHVIVANPIWYERIVGRAANRAKCTMFWYCPDPGIFYPRQRLRHDSKFVVIYPGTLNWHQGVDVAIRAFPRVLENIPEAEFHIYGEGPARPQLMSLVDALGLVGKVKVFASLPLKEIVEIMSESDLGVVPKRVSSGFGNEAASTKISEFMALGVPAVASRTSVEACLFSESIVRYVTSEDEEELAAAIVEVWRDPNVRMQLIANSTNYVKQVVWTAGMANYLALVDDLIKVREKRHPKDALAGSVRGR